MFEIGKSKIHGCGCIATAPIAAGELIGRFHGEPTDVDGPHVIWMDDERALRVTNDLRFLNHARDANAEVDEASLEVRCSSAISRGEEITIHYGPGWE